LLVKTRDKTQTHGQDDTKCAKKCSVHNGWRYSSNYSVIPHRRNRLTENERFNPDKDRAFEAFKNASRDYQEQQYQKKENVNV